MMANTVLSDTVTESAAQIEISGEHSLLDTSLHRKMKRVTKVTVQCHNGQRCKSNAKIDNNGWHVIEVSGGVRALPERWYCQQCCEPSKRSLK